MTQADLHEDITRWLAPTVEALPPIWDAGFVGKRLVEAYAILLRTPPERAAPRGYGCGMPAYVHDVPRQEWVWNERKGRAEKVLVLPDPDHEGWKYEEAPQETVARPTGAEVARMEIVLAWPGRFLAHDAEIASVVGSWALWSAQDRDTDELAERMYVQKARVFQAKRREALRLIAKGLNAAAEGVV